MEYRRYLYEQAHGKNAAVPRSTLSRWNKEKRVAQSANDPCNAMEEETATGPEIASNLTDNEDDVALCDLEENEVDIEGDNPSSGINWSQEQDRPIYESSVVTRGQVLSLLLAFFLRHNLSKTALSELLTLLNVLVPNCVPRSNYFIKEFLNWSKDVTEHFYCPACSEYVPETDKRCPACYLVADFVKWRKKGYYFLVSSIREQLKQMFENRYLWELILKIKGKYHDSDSAQSEIFTSNEYKSNPEISNFLSSGKNVTLSFSVDGVQPHENSDKTVWPVLCFINELNIYNKQKYTILSSLWFGKNKPDFNTYLKPFVREMKSLYQSGFNWCDSLGRIQTTKVAALLCICDSPARCALLNMKQFNGTDGCTFCYNPGTSVRKPGAQRDIKVYPLTLPIPPGRTHNEILELGRNAIDCEYPQLGVKGPSVVFGLPVFDAAKGTVPDSMHCCWIGVVKQFLALWLTNAHTRYYIGNKIEEIDRVLLGTKPIKEMLRLPRSIKLRSMYKASELRNFALFYSVVALSNLLPIEFYNHWLLFVNSMIILFRQRITPEEKKIAIRFVYFFVDKIPQLYGIENVSYNIFLLLHVVDTVDNWGAPWAYSAFLSEHLGGLLNSHHHGTTQVPKQIVSRFHAASKLQSFASKHIYKGDKIVKDLFEKINSYPQPSKDCGTRVLGKAKLFKTWQGGSCCNGKLDW